MNSIRDDSLAGGFERALRHQISRRELMVGAGVIGLGAWLAACTGTSSTSGSVVSKLSIGVDSLGTQELDPLLYWHSTSNLAYALSIRETLVRRDLNAKLVPALASSYTVSSDGLTYDFMLRDGVKMQDGSAFTASDVATAVNRLTLTKPGLFLALIKSLSGVKVIDDHHVQVLLTSPYPKLLDELPAPIPTAYYQKVGEQGFLAQPLLAGPYKFVSQQINSSMTLVRFDDFWDKSRLPNVKNVVFQVIPDESTRISGLQSGALDAIEAISPTGASQLGSSYPLVQAKDALMIQLAFYDTYFPDQPSPLLNANVRKALFMALDRESILKTIYKDYGSVSTSAYQTLTFGKDPNLKPYPYDPAAAKQMLQAAGESSFSIKISYTASSLPSVDQLAQAMASYWQQVGVQTTINQLTAQEANTNRTTHQLRGATLIGATPFYWFDPSNLVNNWTHNGGATFLSGDSYLETALPQLTTTVDPNQRLTLARQIDDYIYQQAYSTGVVNLPAITALDSHVTQWQAPAGIAYQPLWYLQAK